MFVQQSIRRHYWCRRRQYVCSLLVILICVICEFCIANSGEPEDSISLADTPDSIPSPGVSVRTVVEGDGKPSVLESPGVVDSESDFNSQTTGENSERNGRGRSMSSVFSLDPMGMLKSASRVLTKGVHTFRESLHEGVKVAQMLKDDVDEGVTQIWGQKGSNNKETVESQSSVEEKMHNRTEESASEPHSFPQDQGKYSNSKQSFREGMLGGIGGILRFMNVDSSRLGIIALNLLIYVAEMITSSLLGKDNSIAETRAIKANILEYVFTGHSKMVDNLLKDAKSEALPEHLIGTLKDKTGNETSCVQLLICKMSPLIWSVQKTLDHQQRESPSQKQPKSSSNDQQPDTNGNSSNGERPRSAGSDSESSIMDDLYSALPTKDGFVNNGDKCEKRFPNCRLLKFKQH